jgi:DNA invertase Pin-like site-specific DNA recombinase
VADFAGLLDRAGRKGWGLTLLSPNIDTSDAAGRFTGYVLAPAAQYERDSEWRPGIKIWSVT